jgi:hypothetical protein
VGTAARLHALEIYKKMRLTADDLQLARKIYAALTALSEEGPVRMAANLLLDALMSPLGRFAMLNCGSRLKVSSVLSQREKLFFSYRTEWQSSSKVVDQMGVNSLDV